MNQKKFIQLVVLVVVALISYFFGNSKNDPTPKQSQSDIEHIPAQTKSAHKKSVAETKAAVALDYDTDMSSDKLGRNSTAPVDYYMLALSWSPSFCESQKRKGNLTKHFQYQCASGQNFGWVIHGLWPQNKKARSTDDHPRFCQGDLPALPESLIEKYLPESPGASLLQGQWEKHGACAFDSAEAYFEKQKSLFYSLTLPSQNMRRNELFRWVRKNNPQLERVYLGASKTELYICYDKQWQPMDCPQ